MNKGEHLGKNRQMHQPTHQSIIRLVATKDVCNLFRSRCAHLGVKAFALSYQSAGITTTLLEGSLEYVAV